MIGVIADDLSGAAEIGALGLRHGLTAEILIGRNAVSRADLVCVDTDSRSCKPEEATIRTAAAVELLRRSGAEWIYKKVDSVLRGNVTAEIEALLAAMEFRRALLIPANPGRNRIIRNGRYFVKGKPIHETEFAGDPEYPRLCSRVIGMVSPSIRCPIELGRRRGILPSVGIIIGEATKPADLDEWAQRRMNRTVLAGAAEFFAALLKAKGFSVAADSAVSDEVPETGRELFVCGTTSSSAREFLKSARARKTPIFSLPNELVWGAEFSPAAKLAVARRAANAFQQSSRVILITGLPPIQRDGAPQILTDHLVQLAGMILGQVDVSHVYAEGGATAAALVHHMGWQRLAVVRELAPGVARLSVGDALDVLLTIKPGSYTWPIEVRKGSSLACGTAA